MMYIHYCKCCHRIFMLNGHKLICPKCASPISELSISYIDYVALDMKERECFKAKCADEEQLRHLSTTYRMYKYSKWYRELQDNNTDSLPITTLLASQNPDLSSENT